MKCEQLRQQHKAEWGTVYKIVDENPTTYECVGCGDLSTDKNEIVEGLCCDKSIK